MNTTALRSPAAPASLSLGSLSQRDHFVGAAVVPVVRRGGFNVKCSAQPFELSARKDPSKSTRVNAVTDYVPVREAEGHGGVSNKVVGVLGGGQLGRMLCQAASPLGLRVIILDPQENAPAAGLATEHIVGSFKDPAAVIKLAERCVRYDSCGSGVQNPTVSHTLGDPRTPQQPYNGIILLPVPSSRVTMALLSRMTLQVVMTVSLPHNS